MRAVIVLSFLAAFALAAPAPLAQSEEIVQSSSSRTESVNGVTSGSSRNFESRNGQVIRDEETSFGNPSSEGQSSNREGSSSDDVSADRGGSRRGDVFASREGTRAGGVNIDRDGNVSFN